MSHPVLIVEDDALQREMLGTLLHRKLGLGSLSAENGRSALDILDKDDNAAAIKLVILDVKMPVMGGLEALGIIRQKYPAIAVLMLTGSKDVNDAVMALKLGAVDFLNKPYEGERMITTVRNALKISTLTREVSRLHNEKQGHLTFDALIGAEGGLAGIIGVGRKAAASDIPVLVTGETGTGKELFAKAVHGESARAGKAFVAVNCGAIPAQLVESTLFGHEKGAFTGATERTNGKFREAEGGTIFLDEVGELPLDAQVKLLRVLQQKEVEPVGASKPVPVNIRIISATNRDLEAEVKAGRFREDLYFRLNVLQMELPPLRDRRADIPLLVQHFIERVCAREGLPYKAPTNDLLETLRNGNWPGNVRELENTINRALVMSEGPSLTRDDLELSHRAAAPLESTHAASTASETSNALESISLFTQNAPRSLKTLSAIEKEAMEKTLAYYDGNVTQCAKALGMAKSTFYKKMKD